VHLLHSGYIGLVFPDAKHWTCPLKQYLGTNKQYNCLLDFCNGLGLYFCIYICICMQETGHALLLLNLFCNCKAVLRRNVYFVFFAIAKQYLSGRTMYFVFCIFVNCKAISVGKNYVFCILYFLQLQSNICRGEFCILYFVFCIFCNCKVISVGKNLVFFEIAKQYLSGRVLYFVFCILSFVFFAIAKQYLLGSILNKQTRLKVHSADLQLRQRHL